MTVSLPLEGIRILDLSQLVAGPSAAAMLAELGADVIKLESPEGDTSRRMGQARKHGMSGTFAAYNKGKRSIALDLRKSEGLAVAQRLISNCDVLIEAFRPGVMDRFGLGYAAASALRPALVYVSFAGFGADGPMADRPGVDLLIQGESGIMSITGESEGDPMKIGFTAVDAAAGFALAQAILAGVVKSLRTGEGSHLSLSLLDVAVFMQAGPLTEYLMTGDVPPRTGNMAPLGSPAEVFNTGDGTIIISAYFPTQWPDLCRILDLAPLIEDPRFLDNAARIRNRSQLHPILQERIATFRSIELKRLLATTRIIFGDVLDYSQVVEHPQVRHNQLIVDVEAQGGRLASIGSPVRMADANSAAICAPDLGQHGREIMTELGFTAEEIAEAVAAGALI